jgi:hypothetical protein
MHTYTYYAPMLAGLFYIHTRRNVFKNFYKKKSIGMVFNSTFQYRYVDYGLFISNELFHSYVSPIRSELAGILFVCLFVCLAFFAVLNKFSVI